MTNMPLSASIRTRLQYQQETLSELIADLSEPELKQRVNPDKWSAFEHLAHLAAYQPVFIKRLERIGAQGRLPVSAGSEGPPTFERYVADNDPQFPVYLGKTVPELLADIAVNRARITAIFAGADGRGDADADAAGGRGADGESRTAGIDLLLTGRHPKYGLLTTVQWTEFFLLHEAHHLFSIFMLVQDLRSRAVLPESGENGR